MCVVLERSAPPAEPTAQRSNHTFMLDVAFSRCVSVHESHSVSGEFVRRLSP